MLIYAKDLTKKPTIINNDTILKLKDTGLSNQDIFDINQVVSYFNYVNRIVEGLGVQLESEED